MLHVTNSVVHDTHGLSHLTNPPCRRAFSTAFREKRVMINRSRKRVAGERVVRPKRTCVSLADITAAWVAIVCDFAGGGTDGDRR